MNTGSPAASAPRGLDDSDRQDACRTADKSTPQMADQKAVGLPPLALAAAVRPIAASPGHSHGYHSLSGRCPDAPLPAAPRPTQSDTRRTP